MPIRGIDASAYDSKEKPVTRDRPLGTPSTSSLRLILDLPPGYAAVAPVGASAEYDGLAYKSTCKVSNGRRKNIITFLCPAKCRCRSSRSKEFG